MELWKEASELSEKDRADLAGLLVESLEGEPDEEVEAAGAAEIQRRVAELDAGTVKSIPWEAVRQRLIDRTCPGSNRGADSTERGPVPYVILIAQGGRARRSRDGLMSWACPRCDRTFRQLNQRHACGVGSAAALPRGRPPALADLYRRLETTVRSFGEVEVVARDRYALFRTTRIFADLTVTRDALRVVVHLGRKVNAAYFIKTGPSGNRVSHVVLVRTAKDLRTIMPFLREAFDLAVSETP